MESLDEGKEEFFFYTAAVCVTTIAAMDEKPNADKRCFCGENWLITFEFFSSGE